MDGWMAYEAGLLLAVNSSILWVKPGEACEEVPRPVGQPEAIKEEGGKARQGVAHEQGKHAKHDPAPILFWDALAFESENNCPTSGPQNEASYIVNMIKQVSCFISPLRQVYETNKYHVPPAATAANVLDFQILVRDFVGSRFVVAFDVTCGSEVCTIIDRGSASCEFIRSTVNQAPLNSFVSIPFKYVELC